MIFLLLCNRLWLLLSHDTVCLLLFSFSLFQGRTVFRKWPKIWRAIRVQIKKEKFSQLQRTTDSSLCLCVSLQFVHDLVFVQCFSKTKLLLFKLRANTGFTHWTFSKKVLRFEATTSPPCQPSLRCSDGGSYCSGMSLPLGFWRGFRHSPSHISQKTRSSKCWLQHICSTVADKRM